MERALTEKVEVALSDHVLTREEVDGLVMTALADELTTPMLETLAGVVREKADQWIPRDSDMHADTKERVAALETHDYATEMTKSLLWAAPRDVAGLEGSGQSMKTRSLLLPKSQTMLRRFFEPDTTAIRFDGTTTKATQLSFTLADVRLTLEIPAGSTPPETAALFAKLLNEKAEDIVASNVGSYALNRVEAQTCGTWRLTDISARVVKGDEVRVRTTGRIAGSD